LGNGRNVFQEKKNGNGNDKNQFGRLQDRVEHHPSFQFEVNLAGRTTRDHHNVEKFHIPSSSYRISIPTKRQQLSQQ
jgi:hypothetical protein